MRAASLILTIDTEPDLPKRRQSTHGTLRNIPQLRRLQERIPDIKLTLLVTQSVLDDPPSRREIERLKTDFDCEIGAHLHPEDTPPFLSSERRETSLLRIPLETRAAKLRNLISAIERSFPAPTSYRAGRWKIGTEDFTILREQGIRVDSTVTPYVSWQLEQGPDWSGATPEPYQAQPDFWEVPVTIGLNRGTALARLGLVRRYLQLFSHPANSLRFPLDLAWAWGRPISPVWFRPTYTSLGQLESLGRAMLRRYHAPVLNMMFHSNELVVGGRPFIREQADVDRIVERIVGTCRYFVDEMAVRSTTLSGAVPTVPRQIEQAPGASRRMSVILGISALDKDAAAALVVDGRVVSAVAEERLTRRKHQPGFPTQALATALADAGLKPADVERVTYPFFYWTGEVAQKIEGYLRDLATLPRRVREPLVCARHQAYYLAWLALTSWRHRGYNRALGQGLAAAGLGHKPLHYLPHHATHAASAYYCSSFDRALVATFDWYGSGLAGTIWLGQGGRLKLLKKLYYPHSLGLFYASVTRALGFRWSRHEGKVVGLAAFGDPDVLLPQVLARFERPEGDVRFLSAMDLDYPRGLAHRYRAADVAAAHQAALERIVVDLLRPYLQRHGLSNVALAGGVAANVKLNQRVHELEGVESIFIHPAMGDDGTSAGGPLYWLGRQGRLQPAPLEHVYLGNELRPEEIRREVESAGLPFQKVPNIAQRVGVLLAAGKVVARVAGRSEYGPRALGHRSILCSAADQRVNEWLNERLGRTEFMPFAPITLWEHRAECYEGLAGAEHAARFMTITFNCTPAMKQLSPAAVHVDGTARPQLVERQVSPDLHAILSEYHRQTGSPSLINTSYNMHEDPIVGTARDAVATFKRSGLDYLALGDFLISQAPGGPIAWPDGRRVAATG